MATQAVKHGPSLHGGVPLAPEIFPAGEDFDAESEERWSEDVSNVIFGDSDYQQMRSLDTAPRTMVDGVCGDCRRAYCPAFNASFLDHLDCLQQLHREGSVLSARDVNGATPLHAACEAGNLQCANFLVERTGAELRARDSIGNTPAHHAAYHGQLNTLKFLFEHARVACITDGAQDGATPSHYAAVRGHLSILQWLFTNGANMNEVDSNGATPLYFAAQEGHTETVGWLVANADADPTHPTFDGMCALHAAAQTGHVAAFAIMLRFIHKRLPSIRDNDGATCMHFAAAQGHSDLLRLLLSQPGVVGEEIDNGGCTPAHDAAEHGQYTSLRVLMSHGVDMKIRDRNGNTPLDTAQKSGHEHCINLLSGRSASGSEETELLEDLDALVSAAAQKQTPALLQLFDTPAPISQKSSFRDNGGQPNITRVPSIRHMTPKNIAALNKHALDVDSPKTKSRKFWSLFKKRE